MKLSKLYREAETIKESESLSRAREIMREKHADFVVVLSEDSQPLGITTAYELLERERRNENLEKTDVKNAMLTNILILEEDEEKEEAIKTLLAHKYWFAVVIDKNKKFKGIITACDLI